MVLELLDPRLKNRLGEVLSVLPTFILGPNERKLKRPGKNGIRREEFLNFGELRSRRIVMDQAKRLS